MIFDFDAMIVYNTNYVTVNSISVDIEGKSLFTLQAFFQVLFDFGMHDDFSIYFLSIIKVNRLFGKLDLIWVNFFLCLKKNPALGFIFITLLIDITGLGIIIPVLPSLIQELTGGTLSEASMYGGWMLFAYAFMQFICAPILGGLSDRYGRRPVLLASLFGFGIDYIFLALAPTLGWLFVGRIIAGIMGASFTTASAYIADVSTPETRAQNFGIMGAAFGLGFIIGPMLGGFLETYGSRVPFMVSAGLSLLNWLYGFFILPESLKA